MCPWNHSTNPNSNSIPEKRRKKTCKNSSIRDTGEGRRGEPRRARVQRRFSKSKNAHPSQISPPNVEPNHPQLKIFPQEDPHSTFVHASHEIPGTLVAAHRPRKYDILQPLSSNPRTNQRRKKRKRNLLSNLPLSLFLSLSIIERRYNSMADQSQYFWRVTSLHNKRRGRGGEGRYFSIENARSRTGTMGPPTFWEAQRHAQRETSPLPPSFAYPWGPTPLVPRDMDAVERA